MAFRNPIVLINGQLRELPGYDRLRNNGNIIRQQATPVDPVDGDLWFDTGNNLLKIWDGSGFTTVGGGSGGGAAATVSPTAPATPGNGSLWYDTAAGFLKSTWPRPFNGCQLSRNFHSGCGANDWF